MPEPIQLNEQEKSALESANQDSIIAKALVYNAQTELEQAQTKVRDAQNRLNEAEAVCRGVVKTLASLHHCKGNVRIAPDLSALIPE